MTPSREGGTERELRFPAGPVTLEGNLALPRDALGVVLFAHGSGSSRFSSRNRFVAEELQAAGLGTLLIDLLTPAEEEVDVRTREFRFDIPRLAERLVALVDHLRSGEETRELPVGLSAPRSSTSCPEPPTSSRNLESWRRLPASRENWFVDHLATRAVPLDRHGDPRRHRGGRGRETGEDGS